MLNPDLKLNNKLFDENVEIKPTRAGYGEGLLELGEKNPNVVALCADLTESTYAHLFAQKYPERFFQVGVAEQNMAAIAAGLAISGKIPFISSYATFSPGKNWETIRTTVAYDRSNVKIAGHHAGIMTGQDGATHQATEDIASVRSWPNIKILVQKHRNGPIGEVSLFFNRELVRFESASKENYNNVDFNNDSNIESMDFSSN